MDVVGRLDLPNAGSPAPKIKNNIDYFANPTESILNSQALDIITRQMRVSGNINRTISSYVLHVEHFQSVTHVQYVEDITANTIYNG